MCQVDGREGIMSFGDWGLGDGCGNERTDIHVV